MILFGPPPIQHHLVPCNPVSQEDAGPGVEECAAVLDSGDKG